MNLHTVTRMHTDIPFQPGSADIVPPAFVGLSPVIGCPLALKVPQAIRAFLLTEVTPDCH